MIDCRECRYLEDFKKGGCELTNYGVPCGHCSRMYNDLYDRETEV